MNSKNTDKEKATVCQKAPTFNEALQSAKEAIGFFANGDLSFVANDAKRLWYCIDDVQQGKATNTQPHIASINGQLLEEIKHYKAQADKLAEALREYVKNGHSVPTHRNAEAILEEYDNDR